MVKARIRCPLCGHMQDIEVPENSCLQFYRCEGCGQLVQTPANTCCVICAYSEAKCPAPSLRGSNV